MFQRRVVALAALLLVCMVAGVVVASQHDLTRVPAECTHAPSTVAAHALPRFTFQGEVTTAKSVNYDPTGELMFPSVFHAGAHLEEPLGEWYLYFSPHERPGGIALMYADSLDGPWTSYPGNPIVERTWDDHYSVSHVASPDVVWIGGQAFMYFHGENGVTRYATSSDGLHWVYGGEAVRADDIDGNIHEASYARVFPNPAGSASEPFAMMFMDADDDGQRRIRVADSPDGRTWTVRPAPLVMAADGEGTDVSSADLWSFGDELYVVYHASDGRIHARTTDPDLTETGPPVVLYAPSGSGIDMDRVGAPQIVTDGDTVHLFYEAGPRLHTRIAMAAGAVPATARSAHPGSDERGCR